MSLLEKVYEPGGLKKLNIKELELLAEEIRAKIVGGAYNNGGHLASNLGVIELTIAIHYVFDIPNDKLLFDVGHQCYTHKILSGRGENFETIRKEGGLSGFPSTEESPSDAFSSGHAGTAIGAGIGYCYARDRLKENYKVISVVGDASFFNGLSSEAMAIPSEKPKNFLVILNDNGMSISKNTGGLYKTLSKATTKSKYQRFKKGLKKIFKNSFITKFLNSTRNFFKKIIKHGDSFLDSLGFKYIGVVDGHDFKELISTLELVKKSNVPILLHVETCKGKGHKNAEAEAQKFHGVGKHFARSENSCSEEVGLTLDRLMDSDDKIVAITAAMTDGTGLSVIAEKHPNSLYDVGICEEYAVTLASGMALAGIKPVVCIYSTFLQRAYDQILHDVCLQNLGVVFCVDRAGFVGADGATHQGLYDLSYLSSMPNMTVLAPKNSGELKKMLTFALTLNTPVAIRYPNGKDAELPSGKEEKLLSFEQLSAGEDVSILAVGGRLIKECLEAAKESGRSVAVYNARCIKPLDEETLLKIKDTKIITLEENVLNGGFGSAVDAFYQSKNIKANVKNMGVKTGIVKHASVCRQIETNGLSKKDILTVIKSK